MRLAVFVDLGLFVFLPFYAAITHRALVLEGFGFVQILSTCVTEWRNTSLQNEVRGILTF